jgi:hypothetical protein
MSEHQRMYEITLCEDELDTVIEALIERSASTDCPVTASQLHDLAHKFLPCCLLHDHSPARSRNRGRDRRATYRAARVRVT